MYGVDLAWEVGESQFGIRAVSCQPTSIRLTSLLQRPKDDVGWCLSLMVATCPTTRDRGLRAQLAQQNQGPSDAEVPPAPVNQPAAPEIPDVDPVIPENPIAPEVPVAQNNGLSFSRRRGKKRPKLSRIKSSKARPHNKKVKEDLRVKTTTGNTAATNRKGSGMQEDRGINRIFPRRRMLLIATVIPLVRNVGKGTREIAVLETVAVFYVARKATMLEAAISIPRVRRINKENRDLNFTLHR
ncbi:hypothetical protein TIFTF001_036627 [Ficus carica]|uniref:Uncharacterized protein n=1 Tax=Ficus carica TaxID=3494 RepID=A0AA88E3T1_FICCA|nr:hypothetical protein TIFTF001_036627 [Ficus carica]